MKTTNLSITGEYLIYRDTWVVQYHGKATQWRPLLVVSREPLRAPQGEPRAPLGNPAIDDYEQDRLF